MAFRMLRRWGEGSFASAENVCIVVYGSELLGSSTDAPRDTHVEKFDGLEEFHGVVPSS